MEGQKSCAGTKAAQPNIRSGVDLSGITKNIRNPCYDLFHKKSTGENDKTGLNKHTSQSVSTKIPEENVARKERISEEEELSSQRKDEVRRNNSEILSKKNVGDMDEKSVRQIMDARREPRNDLFHKKSTGENDETGLNKYTFQTTSAKIPEKDVVKIERMQEGEIQSSQRKEEVQKNNLEIVSKKNVGDTNDEKLGLVMSGRREPCQELFDETYQRRKTVGKETDDKSQAETKIKETDARHHENVKEVMQNLLHNYLVLCINGKSLLMKKKESYVPVSISVESEIMHLKKLLRKYNWELNPSEYKTIIKELKTEPDIWVENIEMKDGKYDISFCGGNILRGVYGEFDDYMVQGQMYTKRKPFTKGILSFVNECCEISTSVQVGSSELFYAYQSYMAETADYLKAKQNQFVPFLISEYGVFKGSTGKKRTLIGICLRGGESLC